MVKPFSWRKRWPDTVSRVADEHHTTPTLVEVEAGFGQPRRTIMALRWDENTYVECCGQGCSRCKRRESRCPVPGGSCLLCDDDHCREL